MSSLMNNNQCILRNTFKTNETFKPPMEKASQKKCKHHSKCMLGIHTASITAWQWLQCPPQEWSFTATDFFIFFAKIS